MASVLTCEPENLTFVSGQPSCTDWILIEYTDASNLIEALDSLFGFDPLVFAGTELLLITAFFIAFGAGKLTSVLRRV